MLIAMLGTVLLAASAVQDTSLQVADTARPVMPDSAPPAAWPVLSGRLPAFPRGPVASVTGLDGSTETYLRTGASVRFEAGTGDAEKEAIISRFALTVLGATNADKQKIFVTFADPGPTYADVRTFLNRLQDDPGVAGVLPILVSPIREKVDAADS